MKRADIASVVNNLAIRLALSVLNLVGAFTCY